jgi:hypothetical protein
MSEVWEFLRRQRREAGDTGEEREKMTLPAFDKKRGGALKKLGIRAPKLNRGMFSGASDEWETPKGFFDAVDSVFHFTLDVCADHSNAKCQHYYTKEEDGLSRE